MANPDQIWSEAVRVLERGKPFVLATVVNVRGSTPREVGAKMIVREDGQFGTIGGGCGEAEVFRKARILLEDGGEARLAEGAPLEPVSRDRFLTLIAHEFRTPLSIIGGWVDMMTVRPSASNK